ncbi:filamentous hemagglutinin N-terminal domain-containing protein [uncultured Cloacibacillus sp.]|uniref:filamentous hemagglutinin N-terminal domain-containing protein n=1 Tax=uncultured Cloacibacillus sp. TaxID=889794 RepID=UPI00262A44C7|nr:filamentous hemagglutinin N-terminal domain-containing protein [uncultured Cloacibacillus sp.]
MINRRKITKTIAYAILLCFTSLTGAQPLYAIPANTQLPIGPGGTVGVPQIIEGNVQSTQSGNTLTLTQNGTTSVLKWDNFSIGADASVNFVGPDGKTFSGLNSLNYVAKDGPISEIYGQLTALGGNIFIANPAGVQIGNSAQINVGSLYVTNKELTEVQLKIIGGKNSADDISSYLNTNGTVNPAAELMSLGAIVDATKVTFDGGRIVLDTDRIYQTNDVTGEPTPVKDAALKGILNIRTTDADEVVLGYTAYKNNTYASQSKTFTLSDGNGTSNVYKGYMWVEDLDQLRAMDSNLSGNYALRNSIDANATADDSFDPIGGSRGFYGNFDGLGYSIFGLTVDVTNDTDPAGLFGFTNNAIIRNFTLNGGLINGTKYVGAAVGSASGGTIENITSTATVKGTGGGEGGVGGIVGRAASTAMSGLINIGSVSGTGDSSSNIGGVVGNMSGGTLTGETYNLGHVSGGHEVGGIVGSAVSSTIGNEVTKDNPNAFQIYNQLDVDGGHNVGGIVGSITGDSVVTNAANHGDVTAEGYDTETYEYHKGYDEDTAQVKNVRVANVGGIVGRAGYDEQDEPYETESKVTISDVLNDGDVTTATNKTPQGEDYYIAGNVGGIVGRANNTAIENAENKENTVAGAHNVGGIAGFLTGDSTVDTGVDIGVNNSVNNGGDITATGARTDSGFATEQVRGASDNSEAFNIGNIGGIVGYLFGDIAKVKNSGNRGTVSTADITSNSIPETAKAANVGGVVGKIDNKESSSLSDVKKTDDNGNYTYATVANSYNTGDVRGYTGVGGVAGMMYNGSIAGSYNLGAVRSTRQLENLDSIAPLNMGGVVGDTTEETHAKAVIYDVYNAGQIGDEDFKFFGRHVGGVVGRLSGYLDKAYNTGAIYNGFSVTGGVVGWWYDGNISNVFNTGNITVVNKNNVRSYVGGIVGEVNGWNGKTLEFAYNLGTLRSFRQTANGDNLNSVAGIIGGIEVYPSSASGKITIDNVYTLGNLYTHSDVLNDDHQGLGAIYLKGTNNADNATVNVSNAYYIKPNSNEFKTLEVGQDETSIDFDKRNDPNSYSGMSITTSGNTDFDANGWRIYDGTTPILNAFLPNMAKNETEWKTEGSGINNVQYGTAANPLLTIINLKEGTKDIALDWSNLGLYGAGSLAVNGGGLTIEGFASAGDGRYFGGTIFSEGALSLTGTGTNFNLGSASKLYGSSVTLNASGGDISAYGQVTATDGDIEITGRNVEVIGGLQSSTAGKNTQIEGISQTLTNGYTAEDLDGLNDPNTPMKSVSEMFTHTTGKAENDDNISVTASGNAEILYGNLATGSVASGGSFSVKGTESVYVDSNIGGVGGNISLKSNGEVLLDITNIAAAAATESSNGKEKLLTFLEGYAKGENKSITLESGNDDTIIAVDMWNNGAYDFTKYDGTDTTLRDALDNLSLDGGLAASDITHIWISDENQLKGVQTAANGNSEILGYNFALKGDINAAAMEDGYEAIGGDTGYSGTFDGRGFRIIGLNSGVKDENKENASEGIFSKLSGTVRDLRVYASKFFGNDSSTNGNAGAIAAVVEEGAEITGVTTFGNRVEAGEDGNAGGIAGTNEGTITDSTASDSVIANGGAAGGVAGINQSTGIIGDEAQEGEEETFVTSDSAVTSGTGGASALGGIVGENEKDGEVRLANSLGVTNGGTNVSNVGGIAGKNSGTMHSLYNESIVSGSGNVGGVAGDNSGTMTNAVNTTAITAAGDNAGGIAGYNGVNASIKSGRNAGAINGTDYVGGMVGKNDGEEQADGKIKGGILTNLSNALVAAITGKEYVGGVAGSNAGEITSDNNLTNEGTVSGAKYVGGIAGENKEGGLIENVISDTLVLKAQEGDAQYFGGIAGTNSGTITNATNESSVTAEDAEFVGGIAGQNSGWLTGTLTNNGTVKGKANVGGLAGSNANPDLLKGTETNRLTVTNTGDIIATEGGAAGIFHTNTGDIQYADISNSGTINGLGNGTVKNTGGLFGENSGNVIYSSLTNSGEVIGGENTGGLIGKNTGKITGGRTTAGNGLSYYAYKIYNNGTVSGTTNVGGLIGYNADESGTAGGKRGSLYAAYNTGVVTATGNNAGGIAGTNAGDISSVFNTVMTAEGSGEIISGMTNVGGIVGSNSGTLANAYNTTGVVSDGTKGSAVGSNSGTVTNVYATNTDGKLIGETNGGTTSNVYSFAEGDTSATVIDEDGRDQSESYNGFDFKKSDDDDDAVWKSYDGYNTPLLKVFLTEAKYTDKGELVYNASEQKANGNVTTADDTARNNVNSLLSQTTGNINAGDYMAYYSSQIAANTTTNEDGTKVFNPNNLGYDIENNIYNIAKAQLNVSLDDIFRVYGNETMYSDEDRNHQTSYEESFHLSLENGDRVFTAAMEQELEKVQFTQIYDGAVEGLSEGQTDTNDAGTHRWSAEVQLGALANNYEFVDGNVGSSSLEVQANSFVEKATLNITLNDVERVYGSTTPLEGKGYGFVSDGLTNGDEKNRLKFTYNSEYITDGGLYGDRTSDAGSYTWTIKADKYNDAFSGVTNLTKNYKINFTEDSGKSTVHKRELFISSILATIMYGNQDGKGYTVTGGDLNGIVYNDDVELAKDFSVENGKFTGMYEENKGNRDTGDVGSYNGGITYSGLKLTGTKAGNYTIQESVTGSVEVTQANLDITLDNVERTYGDTTLTNDTSYGFVSYNGLTNGDEKNGLKFTYNSEYITDGGLNDDRTSDAGSYTWTIKDGKYEDAFTGVDNLTKNYKINFTEGSGKSTVQKRQLTISDILATIIYGDQNRKGYTVTGGELEGIVYNDDVKLAEDFSVENGTFTGTYKENKGNRVTGDVGSYDGGVTYSGLTLTGTKAGNYTIQESVTGRVDVTPAKLTITADDHSMEVGDVPSFTGTTLDELQNMLVNGDKLTDSFAYSFGVKDESILEVISTYPDAIGLFCGDTFYGGGVYNELGGLFANYEVTLNPGTLTVRLPQDDGFIDNYGHLHWLRRGGDRNWNFRERKAEIYLHEGGMDYEENM